MYYIKRIDNYKNGCMAYYVPIMDKLIGYKTLKEAKQKIAKLPTENQIERNPKFKVEYVIDKKVAWCSHTFNNGQWRTL